MPDVIPASLSRRRTERARGSSNVVEKSLARGHEQGGPSAWLGKVFYWARKAISASQQGPT